MSKISVIQFLSEEWILYNIITLVFVFLFVFVPTKLKKNLRYKLANILSSVVLLEVLFIQGYYFYNGIWTIEESMPFHMCRLMWLASFFLLYMRSQIAFEFLLFIGMMGGVHSLLTPQLIHGQDIVLLVDYFFVHGGLIVAPLFCVFCLGMRPRKNAWYRSFFYLQIPILIVGIIDFFFGGNYMYLSEKPLVNNPFLIGDWPYYIVGLELATLLHSFIVYIPFYLKKSFLFS